MRHLLNIARREIVASLHAPVALIVTTLFLVIAGGSFFLDLFDGPHELSLRPFFTQAPLLLAFFIPALTMGRFADEKKLGTLELLLTLPTTPLQLVLGKLLAVLAVLTLALACTLTYPLTLATLGPLDWGPVLGGYLGLLLLGTAYTAIGLMVSSWTRDALIAILVAFFLCFALYAVDQLSTQPATLRFLESISASAHFRNIARGVLDLADVLYFLTVSSLALIAAHASIHPAPRSQDRLRSAVLAVVMLGGSIALANGLAPARLDLTRDQRYTLTPASRALIQGLPDGVEITVFVSNDLPVPEHRLAEQLADLLGDYEAEAEGKITVEIVTGDAPSLEPRAEELGVKREPLGQRSESQVALRLVFRSAAISLGDRREVLPGLSVNDNLEYRFSRALTQLTREQEQRRIAFLAGYGGPVDSQRFIPEMQSVFEQVYGDGAQVESLHLPTLETVPPAIDALIVLNPTQPLGERAHEALHGFIAQGGALAMLQSPTALDSRLPQAPMRQTIPHDVSNWLARYGVELRRDLLLDRQHNVVSATATRFGQARISNPGIPMLPGVHPASPITHRLDLLVMPYPSTIVVQPEALRDGAVAVTELLSSDADAVRRPIAGRVELAELSQPTNDEARGPHLVAAALAGRLLEQEARLVVVGNGDFLFPQPQVGYEGGWAQRGGRLFLNIVDWLTADEALIGIRDKGMPQLIGAVPPERQRWLQLLNVAGVPALFACVSLVLAWRRRRWRRAIQSDTRRLRGLD